MVLPNKAASKQNLRDRIAAASTIKETSVLSDSKFFDSKDMVETPIPMINVALSGKLKGGITPGLTVWAGQSKHFKSLFSLLLAATYLEKYDDAVLLFYDSEFGTPKSYWESLNIDTSRVVHTPITDIEQLKFDIMKQLSEIKRGDKIIIVVDSIGNLASKKEVEDALAEKSVADMTRAKSIKSLFRMVTPHLNIKDISMIVVNHTYKSMGLFPVDVVSGGTGPYLSADNIYIITRNQIKDDKVVTGYNFTINVEKSRYVKEKSRIPITVQFDSGISRWSGLLDIAVDGGFVRKEKKGASHVYFNKVDAEKAYTEEETNTRTFWEPVLNDPVFNKYVEDKFALSGGSILDQKEIKDE